MDIDTRCGFCPVLLDRPAIGVECPTYSAEYVPQRIPVLEGSTRVRAAGRCGDCAAAVATAEEIPAPGCEAPPGPPRAIGWALQQES